MKTCTKCNVEKSLDEYHKAKKGALGRAAKCKQCKNKQIAAWKVSDRGAELTKINRYSDKAKATRAVYLASDIGRQKRKKSDAKYNAKPTAVAARKKYKDSGAKAIRSAARHLERQAARMSIVKADIDSGHIVCAHIGEGEVGDVVYVLVNRTNGIKKVGMSVDVNRRVYDLNKQGYGGLAGCVDWSISKLISVSCGRAVDVESFLHNKLRRYALKHEGVENELFACSMARIDDALGTLKI